MAVTKRTRFEVLRRDNYTCRYCRSTDGALTVDHVTPRSLGGSDDPSNLVACCKDCNAGKSSAAPDASLVAEVTDDAIRHAERIKQAYKIIVEQLGEQDDYIREFVDEFPGRSVPQGWKGSLIRWFEMGVPIEIVIDAGHRSDSRMRLNRDPEAWFKYLAGVVWRKVETVTDEVKRRDTFDGSWHTDEDLSSIRCDAYGYGFTAGEEAQKKRDDKSISHWQDGDVGRRLLLNATESTNFLLRDTYESWCDRRSLEREAEMLLESLAEEPA